MAAAERERPAGMAGFKEKDDQTIIKPSPKVGLLTPTHTSKRPRYVVSHRSKYRISKSLRKMNQ